MKMGHTMVRWVLNEESEHPGSVIGQGAQGSHWSQLWGRPCKQPSPLERGPKEYIKWHQWQIQIQKLKKEKNLQQRWCGCRTIKSTRSSNPSLRRHIIYIQTARVGSVTSQSRRAYKCPRGSFGLPTPLGWLCLRALKDAQWFWRFRPNLETIKPSI